ncbi:MAG TPA: hypothetical protein V6C72_15495 [Chroococcales cyanobacterium]
MTFNEVQPLSSAQNTNHAHSEALLKASGYFGPDEAASQKTSWDPYEAIRAGIVQQTAESTGIAASAAAAIGQDSGGAAVAAGRLALDGGAAGVAADLYLGKAGDKDDYFRLPKDDGVISGCFPGPDKGDDSWLPNVKLSNLPEVDRTGFQQEAPDNDNGFWHQIGRYFSHHDTLDEKVRQGVIDHLSSKDKDQYDREEQAMRDYRIRMATMDSLVGGLEPPPNCPMHDKVDRLTEKTEEKIAGDVRSHMTPTDLKRVDKQMQDYDEAVWKWYEHGGFGAKPEPGNALKDYWDRLKEATGTYEDGNHPNPADIKPIYDPGDPEPTEPVQPYHPYRPFHPHRPIFEDPGLKPWMLKATSADDNLID